MGSKFTVSCDCLGVKVTNIISGQVFEIPRDEIEDSNHYSNCELLDVWALGTKTQELIEWIESQT